MLNRLVMLLVISSLLPSCSATPGDAAYRTGRHEQAAKLYLQGARNGDEEAALKLGLLVDRGAVSADRFGTATSWFERACDLGSVAGCHNAGVHFEYGKGSTEKSYDKAASFYRKAAERGYMQSQYNLGSMYANQYLAGDVEGLKWLLLARQNADKCASEKLCQWILEDPPGHANKLRERMTRTQIELARQQAGLFSPAR